MLVCEDGVLGESDAILRWADARVPPERRLFPDGDPEVAQLCRGLDDGLGVEGAAGHLRAHAPAPRR